MKSRLTIKLCHALFAAVVTFGTSVPFSESILPGYTVAFLPGEHGAFSAQVSTYQRVGAPTPAAPATPGEGNWVFNGWDPPISPTVSEDIRYVAQWREALPSELFAISFVDWDGSILVANQVALGGNAKPPKEPIREGYVFSGWDRPSTDVQADLVVTAQYTIEEALSLEDTSLAQDQNSSAIPLYSSSARSFTLFGLGIIILATLAIVTVAIRYKESDEKLDE